MAGRRGQRAVDQQHELGRAVAQARASGVRWKAIERLYGRCRRQLARYAERARAEDREMSQKTVKMSHLSGGEADEGDAGMAG